MKAFSFPAENRQWKLFPLPSPVRSNQETDLLRLAQERFVDWLHSLVTSAADSSSHRLHSSSKPIREARPSSVRTQVRVVSGGSWRRCCRWPHAKIARQCCSSS